MPAYDCLNRICSFLSPNRIVVGADALTKLGEEAKSMAFKNTLIVSDKNMTKIGLTGRIEELVRKAGISIKIFDEIETEPTLETMMGVIEVVRSAQCDSVIGLGGGSCLDTAKAASIMATTKGDIRDYDGSHGLQNRVLPKILIPTTAGTGSEVTSALVFSDKERKRFVFGPNCIPELAIVDPMTTLSLPPKVTAATGLDALSHAIESLLTINSNPLSESASFQAIYLIFGHIRTAYVHGNDLEARSNMSYAATLGGLALNSGGSWAHSISYTIGSRFHVPHGLGCAIGLPYSMKLNLYPKAKNLKRVAEAAGEDTRGLTAIEAASRAVSAVKRLLEDLQIPLALKDLNIPKEVLPELARELVTKYPRPTSPCQLTENDALKLYEEMWTGRIKTEA